MNRIFRLISPVFFSVLVLIIAGCLPASDAEKGLEDLIIRTAEGKEIAYQVEIANTDESRRLGLMYREFMPENQGMVLAFDTPRDASIWMKNTYIALDLIYIDKDGKIAYLHKDAIPHDTTSIRSGRQIKAVLEVNANQIEKQGLKIGDLVIHPIFGTS